jgi:accessory gene regulator protein AgrB
MLYIGPSSFFASALMRVVTHYFEINQDIIGDLYLIAYTIINLVLIFVYPHDFEAILGDGQKE